MKRNHVNGLEICSISLRSTEMITEFNCDANSRGQSHSKSFSVTNTRLQLITSFSFVKKCSFCYTIMAVSMKTTGARTICQRQGNKVSRRPLDYYVLSPGRSKYLHYIQFRPRMSSEPTLSLTTLSKSKAF